MDIAAMVETLGEGPVLALGGVAIGALFGFFAQRSQFCLRAASIEFWHGKVSQKVAIWLMAFATAVVWTQAFILLDLLDVAEARQLNGRGSLSGAMIGGLMFGTGMIMTRGCASRLLVLSGTGNLRSLVSGLIMAVAAQSSFRGALAPAREWLANLWVVEGPGERNLLTVLGVDNRSAMLVGIVWCLAAYFYAIRSWLRWTTWFTASLVGGMVAVGWLFTSTIAKSSFVPVKLSSLTFTGPSADVLMFVLDQSHMVLGFDIGLVPGVFLGAFLAASLFGEFKLVGFSDGLSMPRYIVGATLMGFGGMLAGGCAVGAGVSGGAIFALTAWVTLISIWFSAGLADRIIEPVAKRGSRVFR